MGKRSTQDATSGKRARALAFSALLAVAFAAGTGAAAATAECADGVMTTIVDDHGVEHAACVASGGGAAPVAPERGESVSAPRLPTTGTGAEGLAIGGVMVACGAAASLLARRRA